jgi:GWxTD domain-containing protein
MGTSKVVQVGGAFVILLALTGSLLYAVKIPDMPDNFGSDEWAVEHWNQAVGYLKYITTDEQRQKLGSVPENLRKEAWDEFWKGEDPVPSTPENEFKNTYFARIRYANEHYGTNLWTGWLSDRGEVYIRLGPPEDTEVFRMQANGRDIEVWHYWIPDDVSLYFVDQTGFGDFVLENPQVMLREAFKLR